MADQTTILHASCVAVSGRGVLILGPSGSGKSALALTLIALGATLVADDRTLLRRGGAHLEAEAPEPIRGLIEARGFGLIRVPATVVPRIVLAVDLGRTEDRRLPDPREMTILGVPVPLRFGISGHHLGSAILLWLKAEDSPWP